MIAMMGRAVVGGESGMVRLVLVVMMISLMGVLGWVAMSVWWHYQMPFLDVYPSQYLCPYLYPYPYLYPCLYLYLYLYHWVVGCPAVVGQDQHYYHIHLYHHDIVFVVVVLHALVDTLVDAGAGAVNKPHHSVFAHSHGHDAHHHDHHHHHHH